MDILPLNDRMPSRSLDLIPAEAPAAVEASVEVCTAAEAVRDCNDALHTDIITPPKLFRTFPARLKHIRILLIFAAISAISLEASVLCARVTSTFDGDTLAKIIYGSVASDVSIDAPTPPPSSPLSELYPLLHTYDSLIPFVPDDVLSDLIYDQESTNIPDGHYPIKSADLSTDAEYGLYASNETAYEIDLHSYLNSDIPIPALDDLQNQYGTTDPIVLIVHTHGTEAYAENGVGYYSSKDNCRTTDTSKNVIAVGAVLAEQLRISGIPTLHCTEMFDKDSYINAYTYAGEAIKEFTAIYPSIKYVFDVHRDSVISADMTKLRPVTVIDGVPTAQYMCVIGSDERTGTHKKWESNLTLACHLQANLWKRSESLTRRMSIRSASYNQRYTEGSLLLEIGSCGNTLDEAKACAKIVAEELASIIKGE